MKIVAYGGGTNSTAMLIGLIERGEKVDLILFADTGGEKPHTYQHVEHFSKWIQEYGMPEIVSVKKEGNNETLEEDCFRRNALPSKAYGWGTCSIRFKLDPQHKYINNWKPAQKEWANERKLIKLIGYDADEPHRADKPIPDNQKKKYINRYPLLEWDWGRDECIEAIERVGLPLPGKSACYFCPSSKKHEVLQLARQYPDLAKRAVEMEKNAELTQVKGLGRNYAWGDLLAAEEEQGQMFPESYIEIDCGCYDG